MTDALDLLRLRTRRLSDRPLAPDADTVLCWLRQTLRAEENPALDAAIALGNAQGLPVVVLHAVDSRSPYASHRFHRFVLEASRDLESGVEARGLRFVRWVQTQDETEGVVDVAARLARRAAAVVLDDVPTPDLRASADALAGALDRMVLAVDACCAVPMNAFQAHLRTTKAFRAAHTPQRAVHLATDLRQTPTVGRYAGALDLTVTDLPDGLDALIERCDVDRTVPAVVHWDGARTAALARLAEAVETVVPRYKWTRNNPALPHATTRLSPWMHYGVLSPREVARAVLDAEAEGRVHRDARWKFLDELLTWREVYHHHARWVPGWHRWEGLPARARATLDAHADDPRPHLYSLDELAHGQTDDETWNAAQKQFLLDGWMNNNLRMVWVAQILKWRPDPRDAFATACALNDRFSLDGRDAATYGGIRSGFGEAKPWRERPIYGTVAGKTDAALRKRPGVPAWLAEQAARPVTVRAAIPSDPPPAFDRYR